MRSFTRFRLLVVAVVLLCSGTLSAQDDYASLIRENPDRAAGVHHSYEYLPSAETAVPRGYKPFYVSHTAVTARAAPPAALPGRPSSIWTPPGWRAS